LGQFNHILRKAVDVNIILLQAFPAAGSRKCKFQNLHFQKIGRPKSFRLEEFPKR